MKLIVKIFLLSLLMLMAVVAIGRASGNSNKYTFSLPPQAREVTPGVYDLGTSFDGADKVQGLAILHPRPSLNQGKGSGNVKAKPATKCYTYIANGARWRTTEDYNLDPANADGYSSQSIEADVSSAMSVWDSQVPFSIFGNLDSAPVDGVDSKNPDGKNELMFGSIDDANTIAVTVVWYTIGPPSRRQIVEWDQMYNDPDYVWGNAGATSETSPGDTNVMDFANIVTHEIGHSAGMADVYEVSCSEVTEYGYSQAGETKKRTLAPQDIAGITNLYK